uniref:Glucosylceramidase n=1 Tax=Acrobeloides nanus TaxID=290746 RepID=A0A914E5G8_9BILA
MKTNDQEGHGGHLINNASYYQTWSNYFVRFFEEYSKNGVTFWGVTMQNEPVASSSFQSMLFNSSQERDFAKNYWGQTMRSNPTTNNLKLMILDDNRQRVTDYTDTVFNDTDSSKYIDGCAIHWYNDDATRPESLTTTHEKHPDKFLLYTEACNEGGVKPGQWSQADNYMKHIMPVLQNWVVGWTDWNLCLDPRGGPNWDNNFVDSPIIVSNTSNEFEKQPMYYALGHIAKFIVPDSVMIANHISGLNSNTKQLIESIAAVNPAGQKVIVINNRDVATSYPVSIVNKKGAVLNLNLEASSFTSIVYSD